MNVSFSTEGMINLTGDNSISAGDVIHLVGTPVDPHPLDPEIEALKGCNRRLNMIIGQQSNMIAQFTDEVNDQAKVIEELRGQIKELIDQNDYVRDQNNQLADQIDDLNMYKAACMDGIARACTNMKRQYEKLAKRVEVKK